MTYCYSVIATVGQSIITNSDKSIRDGIAEWSKHSGIDLRKIAKETHDFPGKNWHDLIVAALHAKMSDPDLLRKASAELNHLLPTFDDAKPNSNDVIHFLASETPEGVLAARVLADFCQEYFDRKTEVHVVEGLQVRDGQLFRRVGLSSLIELVFRLLRQADPSIYKRIISPTGGFKGVVPYLTLIGMLHPDVEISYIYEFSSDLIRLAGLPFTLDFDKMEVAYDALFQAKRDPLSESELSPLLGIPSGQSINDHPLWSLFDFVEDNGQRIYEPSGLGRIVLEQYKDRLKTPIWLSKQAAERYDAFDSNRRNIYAVLFDRLGDLAWREKHKHGTENQATIIKPGNTDERFYYYEQPNGSLVVAELAVHLGNGSDYDRTPTRKGDYQAFRRWGE